MVKQTFVTRSRCARMITMNKKTSSKLGDDNTNFIQPEFIRVKGVEKMFGIKAGTVYQLIRNGMIDSKLLRNRGTIRGIRQKRIPPA